MLPDQDTGKPYSDIHHEGYFIRTFDINVDNSELIWHRDKRNRVISVVSGTGWKLQMDNEIPIDMRMNCNYNISKEVYHRIVKGSSTLVLRITEYD